MFAHLNKSWKKLSASVKAAVILAIAAILAAIIGGFFQMLPKGDSATPEDKYIKIRVVDQDTHQGVEGAMINIARIVFKTLTGSGWLRDFHCP